MAMASDSRSAAAAAISNAISSAAALSSVDQRYSRPEERSWKVYWARYWCFKSQKREKRIVPAARSEDASGSMQGWPGAQAGLGLVPPSSPASFVNSTLQSPVSLSLSAISASMCASSQPNTMFTIGPYAHETQLVSPPVFSTFTTEPSTAPFTPPPELAHLTNPSSPDVPFAQYIASSVEAKSAARETISPLSTSTFASPCDTPVSYTQSSSQYYLGSPIGRLVSPTLGYSGVEMASDERHPVNFNASMGQTVSSFPTYDPFAYPSFDGVPFATFILPCDASSKCEDALSINLVQHDSNHGESVICDQGGEAFQETKTDVEDSRHVQGSDAVTFLETANKECLNTDAGARVSDDTSPANIVSEDHPSVRKGEKLRKLFANERNEVLFSQHTENVDDTFMACNGDEGSGPSASKGGQNTDGEFASKREAVQGVSSKASLNHIQEADIRPVIFVLDGFS